MQYFYLICTNFDETTCPRKVFLQEHQAITWGRRLATKIANDGFYACMEVALYRQPITTIGELEYVKTLEPFRQEELAPVAGHIEWTKTEHGSSGKIVLESKIKGVDYDIDIKRPGDPGIDTTFG